MNSASPDRPAELGMAMARFEAKVWREILDTLAVHHQRIRKLEATLGAVHDCLVKLIAEEEARQEDNR